MIATTLLPIPVRMPWHRPTLRIETLALILSLWFTATCNALFWNAALGDRSFSEPGTVAYAIALGVALTALHFVLLTVLSLLMPRRAIRAVLAILSVITAAATYFMQSYHVYLDPEMIRNVLATDPREAGELLSWAMVLPIAARLLPPLALIYGVELRRQPALPAFGVRIACVAGALLVGAGALMTSFQDFSSFMRGKKEARYLITPANVLYSTARAAIADSASAGQPRQPVGTDAALAAGWATHTKPVLLVVVVGETARAANWGLSGYARQTTPQLAALDVINFPNVTACGTSTEVSVPCMLSAIGRRAYDEKRIHNSEALPHVLSHAGFRVAWLDNQSGCKGTCDGLEKWRPEPAAAPASCPDGNCFDSALVSGARALTAGKAENTVLFLHMIGNHGPNYAKRYPAEFPHFTPTCETADLGRCTQQEIVNTFDNALRYTDHVLAQTIAFLKEKQATHDTAMVFVSDHGESLGENGLYLHGMPYAIAPAVQKEVPMVMWLSDSYRADFSLNADCLRAHAAEPVAHDHLFHTVLGLLNVQTGIYERGYDIAATCAAPPASYANAKPGDQKARNTPATRTTGAHA